MGVVVDGWVGRWVGWELVCTAHHSLSHSGRAKSEQSGSGEHLWHAGVRMGLATWVLVEVH